MKPKSIGYLTELDIDFSKALDLVVDSSTFSKFLDEWRPWLDDEINKLEGKDWEWLAPLVADCRKEDVISEDKHKSAMALSIPKKILMVSIVAQRLHVPWGCAYIRMKEEGIISY